MRTLKSPSALRRAEIAERRLEQDGGVEPPVSVLFDEPKLLKPVPRAHRLKRVWVSVLFDEPKLLNNG